MIKSTEPLTAQILKDRLLALAAFFHKTQDQKASQKIHDLAQKFSRQEFGIAFCGHFSAGKSRMINALLGENLLPSSPIPTSANLVKVHRGEEYALVHFRKGKARKYLAPYDYETIKDFCQDGDAIDSIELSHADIQLPRGTLILDTPGIDSADDAHRIATESAIHLADLIFYVMDYNHVQSEVNFRFTQELTQCGKQVCLVINQIDKHSAAELSFNDFQASVKQSFAAWDVEPAAIFYTSLLTDAMDSSDFPQLQDFIRQQLRQKDALLLSSIQASLARICQEHLTACTAADALRLQSEHAMLDALPSGIQENMQTSCAALADAVEALQLDLAPLLDDGIQQILNNAYLMPFSTRALAEAYLETFQPGFHRGFFFQQKKTRQKRKKRQQAFWLELQEKIQTQLEWHLRNLLLEFFRQQQLEDQDLLAEIQAFRLQPPIGLLAEGLKDGARLTQDGSFVMNYTENTADAVKQLAKRKLQPLCSRLLTTRQQLLHHHIAAIQRQAAAAGCEQAIRAIAAAKTEHRQRAAQLQQLLETIPRHQPDTTSLFTPDKENIEIIQGEAIQPIAVQPEATPPIQGKAASSQLPTMSSTPPQRVLQQLTTAANLLTPLPGLNRLGAELTAAASRLASHQSLITLFGAFSAGKSSFANALIGSRLLPVSPNPTTAAINKIKPVDGTHPHGTVIVKFKDTDILLADLNHALKGSGIQATNLTTAQQQATSCLHNNNISQRNASFLHAFLHGFSAVKTQLGQCFPVPLTAFPDYAAQEEKSCFVEWIEIYYDCPLTRQGITLVDTPGADSINARHTDMAFDFIRRSDAILFVTYYNHAFSRADREFLIQLGRVKDAFQLDKMFFIVNAIDLAADTAEKTAVLDYIRKNLMKYGIRSPQLHAVSSQQLLADKCAGQPPASDFERAFAHFINEELTAISCQAAQQSYQRACQLVDDLMAASQEAAARRPQQQAMLTAQKQRIADCLRTENGQELQHSLQQEANELLYYAEQRVQLRFSDFFRESLNPATLKTGTDYTQALSAALTECLEAIGFDFAQEMRATTVRLESFWQKILLQKQHDLFEKLQAIQPQLSFAETEAPLQLSLTFTPAFQTQLPRWLQEAKKHFKTPRSFFEAGGCRLLEEALSLLLKNSLADCMQLERSRLLTSCQTAAADAFPRFLEQLQEQLDDFYESQQLLLDGALPTKQLQAIRQQLKTS